MMRGCRLTAVLVAVLLLVPEARGAGRASVLVTRVRFSTDAMTSAREALALTRLVEGEVSRAGLRMASEIDKIQSLEGDRWKPLEQCSDSSCIAEIAGASGMDYVLYTDAQDLGGSCVISTSLVSAKTTEKLGMETGQTEFACTPSRLGRVVVEVVQRLLGRTSTLLRRGSGAQDRSPGYREGAIGEQAEDWDLGSAGMEIVAFESEPAGAVVLLDGKLLCQAAPCSKTVSVGQHELSMQQERYQSRTESVTVAKGTKVSWKLLPDFGLLSVTSTPSGLPVKLDGKEMGKTPVEKREVARGGHEVLVSDRCHFDSGKRINVERGEHETVDVALKPREGGIEVTAEDAKGNALRAEVLVDGVKVGTTPGRFKVSICAAAVEVKHPKHGSWKDKLAVQEKQVSSLKAVLKGGAAPGGYVRIEPGSFTMGSPSSEAGRDSDETQHRVTITRPFYLKATEVTQGEWRAVMGSNPSNFSSCGDDCPVEQVSWQDAVKYCNALSKREGLEECYSGDRFKGLSCKGYRLPTEAEWEYAARAGNTTATHGALDAIAWHSGNSRSKTHPVGKKRANAWGLYDMIGNVYEWTNDWYEEKYPGGAVSDPAGPGSGSGRVYRGGGWNCTARFCRAANRYRFVPGGRRFNLGLRAARSGQ